MLHTKKKERKSVNEIREGKMRRGKHKWTESELACMVWFYVCEKERKKERKKKTCSFWHLVVNASVDCTNVNPIFVYFCADKKLVS
jgi:hypothetical protein